MVRRWAPLGPDEIAAWIDSHRETLPRSLNEVSKYPMDVRIFIAAALPPAPRTALWREHIEIFKSDEYELTSEQRRTVDYILENLSRMFEEDSPDFVVMKEVENRVRTAFADNPRLGYRLICELGPSEPLGGIPMPTDP